MLRPIGVAQQYARASGDDLRILVVGAGIAGVTVAQLLRRAGRHPVLIERAPEPTPAGYMLALMPMADAALDELGVTDRYRAASVPVNRYAVRSHTGRLLRTDSVSTLMGRFGDYRGISRGALLDVLAAEGCDVAFATTVTALDEGASSAPVALTTGRTTRRLHFDVVVIADGIGSATRRFVPGGVAPQITDTGWGGWVVWAPRPERAEDADLMEELWGAGFVLGSYPVAGAAGVFLGGPRRDTAAGPEAFTGRVRARLRTVAPRVGSALACVAAHPDPYYWPLTDCRAARWTTPRTALLGDAAAGFLPIAGVGAGMAIESAWVLARALRHADTVGAAAALRGYEQLQRPRVEAAQTNSRHLARLTFRRSRALAWARELAVRMVSVEAGLRPIQRLLETPPDPDAVLRSCSAQRLPG